MESLERKNHWENIYDSKNIEQLSWYQPMPHASIGFLSQLGIPKEAQIIDIGGGDSFFVDHLLDLGYENVTVLDISDKAIEKAKSRVGKQGKTVNWMVSDVVDFRPQAKFDFWHDRAAFHFLTDPMEIDKYVELVGQAIRQNGYLVIGTFSEQGPRKCSGIQITQYSEEKLTALFEPHFEKISCKILDHHTPFDTVQNFIFCSFRRR